MKYTRTLGEKPLTLYPFLPVYSRLLAVSDFFSSQFCCHQQAKLNLKSKDPYCLPLNYASYNDLNARRNAAEYLNNRRTASILSFIMLLNKHTNAPK